MGCCGQRRQELRNSLPPKATLTFAGPGAPTRAVQAAGFPRQGVKGPASPAVMLRYSKRSPVVVRGPATGRQYAFSPTHPIQAVDARDASALLRTDSFIAMV